MDYFSFCLEGFLLTTMGILQFAFTGQFTGKKTRIWHFALYLLLLYIDAAAASVFHFDRLAVGIQLLVLYGMSRFALRNNRSVSSVAAILALHVSQISFGIINPLQLVLFQKVIGLTVLYPLIFLASFIALTICLFCYRFIIKRFSLQDEHRESYIWLLLPPQLFFFMVELYILDTAYGHVAVVPASLEVDKQIAVFVLQLLSLGALFSTLYAYRHACNNFRTQAALASLTQEANAQRTYVTEAQMRYEQTRAFRHDMKNHLSVLDGLLKKRNFEQAQVYLQKLEIVTGDLSFPVHTDNPVIDILLADKLELAKTAGIDVEVSVALPQTETTINDFDLCIIFANAIDNGIQACMQVHGSKFIRIIGERQGDFYMLEFENTCTGGPEKKMGTGLMNVKTVAEKYGGTITIEKSSSLFCLNVLLNISLQ